MIAIYNPNNPAGSILSADDLDRVANIAAKHSTWVLVDEIYHEPEPTDRPRLHVGTVRQGHRYQQPLEGL